MGVESVEVVTGNPQYYGFDESGFQPSMAWVGFIPWGDAPGWYETGLRPSGNRTLFVSDGKIKSARRRNQQCEDWSESAEGAFHNSLGQRPRIRSKWKMDEGL